MLLKIRDETNQVTLHGITLEDGWKTSIDTGELSQDEKSSFSIPHIKSGAWFNTLVLTVLTIDCEHEVLSWSTTNTTDSDIPDTKSPAEHDPPYSTYSSGHKTDSCSVNISQNEDMYHIITSLKESLHAYAKDRCKVQLYENILQLLHYFLEVVVFSEHDRESLNTSFDKENDLLLQQDDRIKKEVDEIAHIDHKLSDIRKFIVSNITTVHTGKYQRKEIKKVLVSSFFLHQLLNDLEHDARKTACNMVAAVMDEEVIARQMHGRARSSYGHKSLKPEDLSHLTQAPESKPETSNSNLQTARHMKETVIRTYETTDLAREILHKMLERKKSRNAYAKFKVLEELKAKFQNDIVEYMEMVQQLKQLKQQVEVLVIAKEQMTSVKEALERSLGDLVKKVHAQDEHDTPTSVFRAEQCLALEKQMELILFEGTSDISVKHFKFLGNILCQCDIIRERLSCHSVEENLRLVPSPRVSEIEGFETNVQTEQEEDHCVLDYIKNMDEGMTKHVTSMSDAMHSLVTADANNFVRVRPCYEQLLFDKLGTSVEMVHTLAFSKEITIIKSHIGSMTSDMLGLTNTSVSCLLRRLGTQPVDRLTGDQEENIKQGNTFISEDNAMVNTEPGKVNTKSLYRKKDEGPVCVSMLTGKNSGSGLLRRYHSTPDDKQARNMKRRNRKASIMSHGKQRHHSDSTNWSDNSFLPSSEQSVSGNGLPTCEEAKTDKHCSQVETVLQRNRVSKYKNSELPNYMQVKSTRVIGEYNYRNVSFKTKDFSSQIKHGLSSVDVVSSSDNGNKPIRDETHVVCLIPVSDSESTSDSDMESTLTYPEMPGEEEEPSCEASPDFCSSHQEGPLLITESHNKSSQSSIACNCKMTLQQEYHQELCPVFSLLQELCNHVAPTDKLDKGLQASQMLGDIGARLLKQRHIEGDTLNDLLVVVLCNVNVDLAASLYVNVEMMTGFLPESNCTNQYGFMVTSWAAVWKYLLSKMKRLERNVSIA